MSAPPSDPVSAAAPQPRTSLRAITLLSGSLFTQFALQFVYQLTLAQWYGAGIEMDAFQAAQTIPMVISTIIAGSLQYAFVPIFAQRREEAGTEAAWELAGTTGMLLIPLMAVLSLLGCLAAEPLIRTLYPGFSEAQTSLTIRLFQVMVWLTWTISVTAFLQTVLQSAQVYRPAAIGPLVGIVVTFIGSWLTHARWGILGIAWSTLVGAFVALLWQAPVYCQNARHRWRLAEGTGRMWWLLLPVLLGAAVYKLDPLVDRYLASGLPAGSVSRLGYATRLMAALLTLTSNGLAMVVFPILASHAASERKDFLKVEVGHALQYLVFLLCPLCMAIAWFPVYITRELFEGGRFTPADTQAVAELLVLSLGLLIGGSLGEILSKTFFALGDTRTPTAVRMLGFAVGVGLKVWWGTQYGLRGLAWATSISYLLVSTMDWICLQSRIGRVELREAIDTAWKCGIATVAALVCGSLLVSEQRGLTAIAAIAGGLTYLSVSALLRESISSRMVRALREKLGR